MPSGKLDFALQMLFAVGTLELEFRRFHYLDSIVRPSLVRDPETKRTILLTTRIILLTSSLPRIILAASQFRLIPWASKERKLIGLHATEGGGREFRETVRQIVLAARHVE